MRILPLPTCILLITLSFCASFAHAKGKVTFAMGDSPPYITQSNGPGVVGEIVRAALKAVDREAVFKFVPWKRAMHMVVEGEAMASLPWSKTREREKNVLFSDPVLLKRDVFIYLRDKHPEGIRFYQLTDLKELKIGPIRGYWYINMFMDLHLRMGKPTTLDNNLRKLGHARIDLVPVSSAIGRVGINRVFPNEAYRFKMTKPFSVETLHVIISKKLPDSQQILRAFNNGLAIIKKNGTYSSILAKYKMSKDAIP